MIENDLWVYSRVHILNITECREREDGRGKNSREVCHIRIMEPVTMHPGCQKPYVTL